MRKLFFILLFFSSIQVFSQDDIETIIEDFNKDGIADTLTSFYSGGSGFGGYYVKIINGKTGEDYSMDNFGCFCEITRLLFVIPELLKTENSAFLEVMKSNLLPQFSSKPEASLRWILAGHKSHFSVLLIKLYS